MNKYQVTKMCDNTIRYNIFIGRTTILLEIYLYFSNMNTINTHSVTTDRTDEKKPRYYDENCENDIDSII